MKILVVCQHYWPEPYPLPDICEELVRRGHTVHLLTDVPNYPMGQIYPGYRFFRNRNQKHNGVKIIRCATIARRKNVLFRVLNYFSFAFSSALHAVCLQESYDVVFTNQTSPILMCLAAIAYAKKRHKKIVMYCMDLWPASLAAGGIRQESLIYKIFGKISGYIYRRMDRILITSEMFRTYLVQQHGIEDASIAYLPQYANEAFVEQRAPAMEKKETVDLMFAGNIGAAQSLETVLSAAERLKEIPYLRWHIIGDGSELAHLKQIAAAKQLKQVVFYGRKPLEEMPAYYSMADAMLVTLTSDTFISLTLPGKVQSYMAAGKPIIAAADGEIPATVKRAGCGFCAGAEDAEGLAHAVLDFIACQDKKALERNAMLFYQQNFTRTKFMDTLEKELEDFSDECSKGMNRNCEKDLDFGVC